MTLDTGKLGWWKNGKFLVKVDNRHGDSASESTGALLPVNADLLGPKEEGTATAITALNYTHFFPLAKPGDLVVLSLGRFDILDQITEPLLGGSGATKFLNINQVAPPHEARNVPLVTWGGVAAWVRKGEPFLSVAFLDSADSSTTIGLSDLFEKGVTIMPAFTYVTHFGGKAGHQGLRATWSNQTTTPFDQFRHIIVPSPNRPVQRKSGSWSVTYSFRPVLSRDSRQSAERVGPFWSARFRRSPHESNSNIRQHRNQRKQSIQEQTAGRVRCRLCV
jgi:hypothetical protein